MDFRFDQHIEGPVDRVIVLVRDRLEDLVPYLPAVDSIKELERVEEDGLVKILNAWQGNSRLVPAYAKPFFTKKMASWKDRAHWDMEERSVKWVFEPGAFAKLYTCGGKNFIQPDGPDRTLLTLAGTLVIHPDKLPMPKRLGRKIAPKLERWIIGKIKPNLMSVPNAVKAFFAEEAARALQ